MRLFAAMLTLLILSPSVKAASTVKLAELKQRWEVIRSGPQPLHFEALIPALVDYSKQAGGRVWEVDYMLGTSYCQSGNQAKGQLALQRVIFGYGVKEEMQKAAKQVFERCKAAKPLRLQGIGYQYVPLEPRTETASFHGKGGFEFGPTKATMKGSVRPVAVPVDELYKRRHPSSEKDEALSQATRFLDRPNGVVTYTSGFVIAGFDKEDNTDVGNCLRKYSRPLVTEFEMNLPEDLITVYTTKPQILAPTLHGVELPLGTIAYSIYQDLTIVGLGDSRGGCGTLAHELTHLAIRQNFGDSPSWLEEGLASEVAVGHVEGDHISFRPSWRDRELQARLSLRPSVPMLLETSWPDYMANNSFDIKRVAALHAMAACFIRYLDAQEKLIPIYMQLRDSLDSGNPRSDQQIVEDVLGKSLTEIDTDFSQWFAAESGHLK